MKFIVTSLRTYINCTNKLITTTGYLVSWLTTILVLVVCYDVFCRYFMNRSIVAIQELEWHLFALIFLLGAASTLQADKHVRVDVLYTQLSEKNKAWINLIGSVIWLIPFAVIVIWTSSKFVMNSFLIRETSPDPGGLQAWYLIKAAIPIGFCLLLLQGVSLCFQSILHLLGKGGTHLPSDC